jgi:glutaredoxin 3
MNKRIIPLLIACAMLGALILLLQQPADFRLSDEPVTLSIDPPQIVIFGTRDCTYCHLAKQFFNKHNLSYIEYDIEIDDEQRRMFDLLGGRVTPLMIINKELLHGFDEKMVRKAL